MRYLVSFVCVLTLGLMGCSETSGAGGSGGAGGTGGAGVACMDDVCPCSEAGIRAALRVGGGPFLFDCRGLPSIWLDSGFSVYQDVILESSDGTLRISANIEDIVIFEMRGAVELELRGLQLWGGAVAVFNPEGALTLFHGSVGGEGGGIISDGPITLVNSTVQKDISSSSAIRAINSTLSGSISGSGVTLTSSTLTGGLLLDGGEAALRSSIVEGGCRCGNQGGVDCNDVVTSSGYNIESPADTCGFDQPSDQVNVSADDLKLGPLQGNGGPTETHALLPGSVAIDQIPEAECVDADDQPLTTDRRGEPRPVAIIGVEAMCDVGAFERQPDDPQ